MNVINGTNQTSINWIGFNFSFSMALAKAKFAYSQALATRDARKAEIEYYEMLANLYSDEEFNNEMSCLAEESSFTSQEAYDISKQEFNDDVFHKEFKA